ncbi:MAG TPA: histone deacetylase [Polyangia bacterium]|jgi:acetoin utilization deacetylase AcuC-like enzyme|nr:histone deacetylase [Polyangia bacterium]
MRVFYSDHYEFPLPEGHRFPAKKYRLLREQLLAERLLAPAELRKAPRVRRETLLRAHAPAYVDAVLGGTLDPKMVRKIGLSQSEGLVDRSLASVGGTLAAALAALQDGVAGNLAGGTHHGHVDAGAGYCVFNDAAVTLLELLARRRIRRAAIIDLDVHQGDGNAALLGGRPDVYILDVYGQYNFPFTKVPATRNVPLPDRTGDDGYLEALAKPLEDVFEFRPDLVLYQAGVDTLAEDRLGRLSMSLAGLEARDERVLAACRRHGVPVALVLGGGYAHPIELAVRANVGTYRVLRRVFPR